MELSKFVTQINKTTITAYTSTLLKLLALVHLPQILVSIIAWEPLYIIVFTAITVISWGAGKLMSNRYEPTVTDVGAIVMTASAYLLYSIVAMIPFLFVGSWEDALFEAMSGFTSTGLSTLDETVMPASLLFYRSFIQWLGGAGIIIISVLILSGPGKTAFRLYTSEFGESNIAGDAKATAKIVMKIYLILTAIEYAVFVLSGMGFFDGLLYALTTISTAGFSPYPASAGYYDSELIHYVITIFMIAGAIGFPAYYILYRKGIKRFFKDIQLHYLLVIILAGAVAIWWSMQWDTGKINAAIFQSVTATTTSGLSVTNVSEMPVTAKVISILQMIIGGSAGSTVGGLKIFRFIVMLRLFRWYLLRRVLPKEAVIPVKAGDRVIDNEEIKMIGSFLLLYLAFLIGSSLIFIANGFPPVDSFFETASALSTVGLSSGITSPGLPTGLKLLLIFDMWVGRVEILPVLIMFVPYIWYKKKEKTE